MRHHITKQNHGTIGEFDSCCDTNGYNEFAKIAFWKTPVAEGGKFVPYSRWTQDYIAIMGGR